MSIVNKVYLKSSKADVKHSAVSILLACSTLFSIPVLAQDTISSSEFEDQRLWEMAHEQFNRDEFEACYQSLQPLNSVLLGEIAFDRLWGLCAHGSGDYDLALMAYNRILAQQTNNAEIRLERARVLFDLGLYQKSREEFQWLLSNNPPYEARVTINNYLNAIEAKLPKVKQGTQFKVGSAIGHDDNVNAAPLLVEFLGFTLDPNSQALDSSFISLQAGIKHLQVLRPDTGLKFSAGLMSKRFFDASVFNQDLALAGLGYQKLFERSALGVDLLAYGMDVDGSLNAKGIISNTHYTYQINPQTIISPYVSYGVLRFSDSITAKNANQYALGSTLKYKLDSGGRHTFGLDYSFGHDNPINVGSNYELDFHKLKFDYRLKLNDSMKITTDLKYDLFDFDQAFFPLSIPESRNDDSLTLSSRLDWKYNERFTISPVLSYRDFESNVDIYTYDRAFAEVNFSYQWVW